MTWKLALKSFCDLYSESGLTVPWIVVGSVGSVIQKAAMTPNDLDIYVQNVEDVARLAALLQPYHAKVKCGLACSDPEWQSSMEEPFFTQTFPSGFTWTKGKWTIANFPVEVVQISNAAGIPDSDMGEGIWEGGQHIWRLAKHVEFENYVVPVVPLEIQLELNIRRQRADRVDAILHALVTNGYDEELLRKALSRTSLEKLQGLL
ncbi:hypothetical protein [Paenibacillus senegalensis]|uniref:hypothetical protein n=1 Tax=Paenibacillus senegalensis TaxID=1465766 RepID=UPI0002886DDA|nr:hypothetical protein [Paenibacillus senegalensis]